MTGLTRQQRGVLAFDMRAAAALLERISGHYDPIHYGLPDFQSWSADRLRREADYLERQR